MRAAHLRGTFTLVALFTAIAASAHAQMSETDSRESAIEEAESQRVSTLRTEGREVMELFSEA